MGYVSVLLGMMFYIYAIIGVHLFGQHDAAHFGSLPIALLSLFQIITLDNWSDLFSAAKGASPGATAAYFVSFILLGTMIMLNLFIGIIMNSMSEMHAEIEGEKQAADPARVEPLAPPPETLLALEEQIAELRKVVRDLAKAAQRSAPAWNRD
jgi:voltage-gated sodium channel